MRRFATGTRKSAATEGCGHEDDAPQGRCRATVESWPCRFLPPPPLSPALSSVPVPVAAAARVTSLNARATAVVPTGKVPTTPVGKQLEWLLGIAPRLPLSTKEISAHFDAAFPRPGEPGRTESGFGVARPPWVGDDIAWVVESCGDLARGTRPDRAQPVLRRARRRWRRPHRRPVVQARCKRRAPLVVAGRQAVDRDRSAGELPGRQSRLKPDL